jgi:DNA-binding response OmpR family regulator
MDCLVVEDNEVNFLLIQTILTLDGWSVTWAKSGEEYRKKVVDRSFDLTILDISLPDADGLQLLQEKLSNSPTMVMSAHAFQDYRQRAMAGGAIAFFPKPFSVIEFRSQVRQIASIQKAELPS